MTHPARAERRCRQRHDRRGRRGSAWIGRRLRTTTRGGLAEGGRNYEVADREGPRGCCARLPESDCADRICSSRGRSRQDARGGLRGGVDPERALVGNSVEAVDQAICGAKRQSLAGGNCRGFRKYADGELVARARVASRGDAAYVGRHRDHEVREVRDSAAVHSRWGGIVDVHTGVHRAIRHGCECAVDVFSSSSSAAYGDCALTDYNRAHAGSRMGCPHAAHVWCRPHEVAVGREVVPHEDGRQGRRRGRRRLGRLGRRMRRRGRRRGRGRRRRGRRWRGWRRRGRRRQGRRRRGRWRRGRGRQRCSPRRVWRRRRRRRRGRKRIRRWRRRHSRAAVGAVGAAGARRILGSESTIVARTIGGVGARLRAGL